MTVFNNAQVCVMEQVTLGTFVYKFSKTFKGRNTIFIMPWWGNK